MAWSGRALKRIENIASLASAHGVLLSCHLLNAVLKSVSFLRLSVFLSWWRRKRDKLNAHYSVGVCMNSIIRFLLCFVLLFVSALLRAGEASSSAAAPFHLQLNVNGEIKTLILKPNPTFPSKSDGAHHYVGQVKGEENTWVRASQFADKTWTGLLFANGTMQAIDGMAVTKQERFSPQTQALKSVPLVSAGQAKCGVVEKTVIERTQALNHSVLDMPTAASSACALVDGVCQFADLELVIDDLFKSRLGSGFDSKIDSMVNMIEGYYMNQFQTKINQVSRTYLGASSSIYSASTDSSIVLDSVYSRRCEHHYGVTFCKDFANYDKATPNPSAFIKEDRSMVQFLTGRQFKDQVAGLAFKSERIFCSNFATSTASPIYKRTASGSVVDLTMTAIVMAHELGHNLNAGHDGSGSAINCPDSTHIMQTTLNGNNPPTKFSSCSVPNVQNRLTARRAESCNTSPVSALLQTQTPSVSVRSSTMSVSNAFNLNIKQYGYKTSGVLRVQVRSPNVPFLSVSWGGKACRLNSPNEALCIVDAKNSASLIKLNASGVSVDTVLPLQAEVLNSVDFINVRPSASQANLSWVLKADKSLGFLYGDVVLLEDNQPPTFSGGSSLVQGDKVQVLDEDQFVLCEADVEDNGAWQCESTQNVSYSNQRAVVRAKANMNLNASVLLRIPNGAQSRPNTSDVKFGGGSGALASLTVWGLIMLNIVRRRRRLI